VQSHRPSVGCPSKAREKLSVDLPSWYCEEWNMRLQMEHTPLQVGSKTLPIYG